MLREAANAEGSFPAPFKNVSSLVFALITVSNWCSEDRLDALQEHAEDKLEEGLVDVSMTFLHNDKPEVRQIASALVHNVALRRTQCTPGWINDSAALGTQILCGVLDEACEESDVLVRKRRMSVALLIVRASDSGAGAGAGANVAAQMILDLGFDAIVAQTCTIAGAQSRTGGREDAASEATVCRELLAYLRPTVRATAGSNPVVAGVPLL
jgi:hypothetical protein